MTNLTINGQLSDLDQSKPIKITKQISDIFELGKVAADYTNSFQLPNTPNNTKIMQGLGIDGNNSRIPYQITKATIDTDGFSIINNGILNVGTTKGSYSVSVMDGNVNFMKIIENKTLGTDIDLSNFRHKKSLDTYVSSLNNPYYRYLIADYGGKFGGQFIYTDWQVASFNVQKLFEAMLSTLEWTYEMHPELATFFDDLWVTYPTVPTYQETPADTLATLTKGFYASNQYIVRDGLNVAYNQGEWDSSTITSGSLTNNRLYNVANSGSLSISVTVEAYILAVPKLLVNTNVEYWEARLMIYRNGQLLYWFATDPYNPVTDGVDIYANAGDVIEIFIASFINNNFNTQIRVNSIVATIKEINQGEVSATEAFKDFTLTQFFKEMLWRTGLVPLPDNDNKILRFKSVAERIDADNAVVLKDEFVEIESEDYTPNGMAQRNIFKMKYNEGYPELNDGIIKVENQNIPAEKTLGESKMFSPVPSSSRLPGNALAVNAPLYTGDEKDDGGILTFNYKSLNNRFYFLRRKRKTLQTIAISYFPLSQVLVQEYDYATVENTLLDQLVFDNFSEYEKIFSSYKLQRVKFNLTLLDVLQFKLDVPYYFRNAYWLVNSITFEEGELAKAEVVRINK